MPATTAARTGGTQPCPDPPRPASTQLRRAFLGLDAVVTSPRCARAWTCEILREWRLACLADDAEAIVSELVANAVLYASTGLAQPVIGLALVFGQGELTILVSDHNPDLPQAQRPAEDDESGRGLLIVKALSDRYSCYPLEGGTAGKAVCAVLRAAPDAPGDGAILRAPAWPETISRTSGVVRSSGPATRAEP